MADRRRQIAALRAKAASTTFPAEAEALRAKADELEAKEAPIRGTGLRYEVLDEMADWRTAAKEWFDRPGGTTIRIHGNTFADGLRIHFDGAATNTHRVQVKNVSGRTYWITVE